VIAEASAVIDLSGGVEELTVLNLKGHRGIYLQGGDKIGAVLLRMQMFRIRRKEKYGGVGTAVI
jgi:hypothetical protein